MVEDGASTSLAEFLHERAKSFADGARFALARGHEDVGLYECCIAIELALKSITASHGWSDDDNRTMIRHDLKEARRVVARLGRHVPRRLSGLITEASYYYRRHRLSELRTRLGAREVQDGLRDLEHLLRWPNVNRRGRRRSAFKLPR
jgi:HEPN domain-containing protein